MAADVVQDAVGRGWQALAADDGSRLRVPPDPTVALTTGTSGEWSDLHSEVRASWPPFLHLLHFGLGWSRPDAGLARWLDLGSPGEDPILRLIKHWYGIERVNDFLDFTARVDTVSKASRAIAVDRQASVDVDAIGELPARELRSPGVGTAVWAGGWDPLHVVGMASECSGSRTESRT